MSNQYRRSFLILSAFVVAGAIHYLAVAVPEIASEMVGNPNTPFLMNTLAFFGMALGVTLVVPLGDYLNKYRLILGNLALLAFSQLLIGIASTTWLLFSGSILSGLASSVLFIIVATHSESTSRNHRARILGIHLTATLLGVCFARVAGGIITDTYGWRAMYLFSGFLIFPLFFPATVYALKLEHQTCPRKFSGAFSNWISMLISDREIRLTVLAQCAIGITYGGFWGTIAIMIANQFSGSASHTGLLGIPALVGAISALIAGVLVERFGYTRILSVGITFCLAAWVILMNNFKDVLLTIPAIICFEAGLRLTMISNQTFLNLRSNNHTSTINSLFGTFIWTGNFLGTALFPTIFVSFGWKSLCLSALGFITISAILLAIRWRTSS